MLAVLKKVRVTVRDASRQAMKKMRINLSVNTSNLQEIGNIITQGVRKLDILDDAAEKLEGLEEEINKTLDPARTAIVDTLQNGMSTFLQDSPAFIKVLDDVAKVHPAVTVVVVTFKVAYSMWRTHRNNDKRLLSLYVSMKDMLSVLVDLHKVRHSPQGQGRMEAISKKAAEDIENCSNACDTYVKKTTLVKVLRGQAWEGKLVDWIATFTQRKKEFEFEIIMYNAKETHEIGQKVTSMDERLSEVKNMLTKFLQSDSLRPDDERRLAAKVQEAGGADLVCQDDMVLYTLYAEETGAQSSSAVGLAMLDDLGGMKGDVALQSLEDPLNPSGHSGFDFRQLKRELAQDWSKAFSENMQTFKRKFEMLKNDLTTAIHEEGDRIIKAVKAGAHDQIKHNELRILWEQMHWLGNVKSRIFVMTLRDNFGDIVGRTTEGRDIAHADYEWAYEYVNIIYLQPIMEAFDDDGSGYVSVSEANHFTESLPQEIQWSLPHWIAYWAIGWQVASARYCEKIVQIYSLMFELRSSIRAENRFWADYYLNAMWPGTARLTASLHMPTDVPDGLDEKFRQYIEYEECRMKDNLEKIKYNIDALDTVYIVAASDQISDKSRIRIEKYVYPLLYLLLSKHLQLFYAAKTNILCPEVLRDAADSISRIHNAVTHRYNDLLALFALRRLDADESFKSFACGMFEHFNDPEYLVNLHKHERTGHLLDRDSDYLSESRDSLDVLKCSIQDPYEAKYGQYPIELDKSQLFQCHFIKTDSSTDPMLTEWNGFIYDKEVYPLFAMLSFCPKAGEPNDGRSSFQSTGYWRGSEFTLSGVTTKASNGDIGVAFTINLLSNFNELFFTGVLKASTSYKVIEGTAGWAEDPEGHSLEFVFVTAPAQALCHRPSPFQTGEDRVRALWRFAIQAVLAPIQRKRRWSWLEFAGPKRDIRVRQFELDLRILHHGRPLDDHESHHYVKGLQAMTSREANNYRLLLNHHIRSTTLHHGCLCDSCGNSVGNSRIVCLDCRGNPDESWRMADFCNPCSQMEEPLEVEWLQEPHLVEHDIMKVRDMVHHRDLADLCRRANAAVNACKRLLQSPHTSVSYSSHNHSIPNNLTADIIAPPSLKLSSFQSLSPKVSAKSIVQQCSVCGSQFDEDKQPCWFCVDCHHVHETDILICVKCEEQMLLKCSVCKASYPQPTWYYGTQPDDNFACGKCNATKKAIPEAQPEQRHSYMHVLVRFTIDISVDDQLSDLEEQVEGLETKVDALHSKTDQLTAKLDSIDSIIKATSTARDQELVGAIGQRVSRLEDHMGRLEMKLDMLLSRTSSS